MNKFESLAMTIFFNGGEVNKLLSDKGLALIEGKTSSDVVSAFTVGMRRGRGKFEREMLEAGIELEKVCKESA